MKKTPITNYQLPITSSGFTMIELLVSIAIMTILIGVFLVNYRGADNRTELNLSAQRMVSFIRLAQNNTLGSAEYNGQIPEGGWGVHFDLASSTNDFYIYADLDEDMQMDSGEYNTSYGARKITLPSGIYLASTTMGDLVDITFLPPDPTTTIWDGFSSSTYVRIQLEEPEGSRKRVLVNMFGLIEALD